MCQSQQEKIDSIEENVNTAAANVEEGTRSLGKVRVCVCVCVVFGRSMALCLPAILQRLSLLIQQNTEESCN
jgi:hypothetical protein